MTIKGGTIMKYFNWLLTNGVNRENGVLIKNFRFLTEKLPADFFGATK